MDSHTVKLSKEGRVLIPANIRADLGLREGMSLSLSVENGEIRLYDKAHALHKAQLIASKYKPLGTSAVDELLQSRRQAAADE
jgi:AbrB family looped-hinge helix DNA binding protein